VSTQNTFFFISFLFVLEDGSAAAAITVPAHNLKRAMALASQASSKDLLLSLQEFRRSTGALFHGVYNQRLQAPKVWETAKWISKMLDKAFDLRRRNTGYNTQAAYVYPANTAEQYFYHHQWPTLYTMPSSPRQHPVLALTRRLAEGIRTMYQAPGSHWQALFNLFRDPWNDFLSMYHLTPDYGLCSCPACTAHKMTQRWTYHHSMPALSSGENFYILSVVTVKGERPIANPDVPQAERVTLGALVPTKVYLNVRFQKELWHIQERRDPEQLLSVLRGRGATLFLRVDARDAGTASLQRFFSRIHRHLCARHSAGNSNPYALPLVASAEERLVMPYPAQEFTLHPPLYTSDAPFAEALQYVAEEILYKYYSRQSSGLSTWIRLFKDPVAPSYTHAIHWTPRHHACRCGICQAQKKPSLTLPEAHFLASVLPRQGNRLSIAGVAEEAISPSV